MPHARLWAGVVGVVSALALASGAAAQPPQPLSQMYPPGTSRVGGPGELSSNGFPMTGSPAMASPTLGSPTTSSPAAGVPSTLPPAIQAAVQSGQSAWPASASQPAQPTATGVQNLSYATDTPMKDLTPAGGFADLIPPPPHSGGHFGHNGHNGHGECGHCGEHHEIPGFLTPFVSDHRGFYGSAEFLLFRPRQTDFDFVIPNSTVGLATSGPIESLKYDLGTGVRAEVGYRFGDGKWESGFVYTYFTSGNEDRTFVAPAGTVLLPTLTRPGLTDRATTATANADLDYHLYDIIAGRRFILEENFAVRAIGGFRFADIRQTFNVFYDGIDARGSRVVTRSRFQGFGPIVGAEAVLVGWKGFHAYSRANFGLISGRCDNRLIETNDSGATTYINTQYNVRKVVPVGSIAIGGGWQYRTIAIRAGYEVTHWHGVFERPRFVDDVSQGKVITRPANLSLEGFFIQGTWMY